MRNFFIELRLWLVRKLLGNDIKFVSNIMITSDILRLNYPVHVHNIRLKVVSDRQSFVLNPNNTTVVS